MDRRSGIPLWALLKCARNIGRHPWIWKKTVALQLDKWLFELQNSQRAMGMGGRIRQASFRITDICNLRCITCGQWGEAGFLRHRDVKELKKAEVPVERYETVLNDLVANGHHPLVYLWGGEPMLYPGTLRVIRHATQIGLPVSIATNGTHIANAASELVRVPLFLLQISIDGHCAEVHNSIRISAGAGDNFKDIENALEAVQKERAARKSVLPLVASLTVISRKNFRHLEEIYRRFESSVDLFVFYLSWWIDPSRAAAHEMDFERRFGFSPTLHRGWIGGWKPDDYAALDEQMAALTRASSPWNAPPVVFIPSVMGEANLRRYYTEHAELFGFEHCVSIFHAVEVDSNGNVSPCRDYHDYVVGNIREQSLSTLWNSPRFENFRKSLMTDGLMPVCSRCCGLMGY